ncbi:hypothetical protein J6590_050908 [Homalodisca vitripennis]|nr:hypothetical protein J6590_050908 [Homalodisca vitripennis]
MTINKAQGFQVLTRRPVLAEVLPGHSLCDILYATCILYLLSMSATCPTCVKQVLDSEEGIGYNGACQRWFHRTCLNMPKTKYQRFCGNSTLTIWFCLRADCLAPSNQPLNVLSSKMDAVLSKLDELLGKINKIDAISADVTAIKNDVSTIKSGLSALQPRVDKAED